MPVLGFEVTLVNDSCVMVWALLVELRRDASKSMLQIIGDNFFFIGSIFCFQGYHVIVLRAT